MKVAQEPEQEINGFESAFELEDREDQKTFDSISEIFEEFIPHGSDFRFTLGKWDDIIKKYVQINVWKTQPPDKHEIGLLYGGGKYQFFLKWKDKTKKLGYALKESKFELHKSYDELKQKSDAAARREEMAAQLPTVQNGAGNNDRMYELLLSNAQSQQNILVGILGKFIDNMGNNSGGGGMGEYTKLLLDSAIKTKETESERMYTMYSKGLEMGSLNQIEQSKDTSWKDLLKDLIPQLPKMVDGAARMFLPKQTIRNVALADPRAKRIMEAPGGKKEFYDGMVKEHGEQKTRETLEKSGLEDLIPVNENILEFTPKKLRVF
jgi:hypothetical protein